MRIHTFILFVLILVTSVYGQEVKLKPRYEKRSSYILTENFEPIRKNVLDSICKEFNVYRTQNIRGNIFYNFKVGTSRYQFSVLNSTFKFDTTRIINQFELSKTFYKGDSLNLKGFIVISSSDGKEMSKKYSKFLLSAFLQETNNEYLNNQENFTILSTKSNSEFWKRNFINMGYGLAYAAKGNPYVSVKGLAVFGYVVEALHYIPIFGGAFIGKTQNDKVVIPIVGLSSLLFWKTVFCGLAIGRPTIKNYNRFVTIKYKTPKTMID